ncbi:MAG: hypothetical protein L3J67_01890 [Hyphomicrobiaceae bacterium]|nr:hypothetical protein [Hyphomicrobiaceae bacterium]
MIRKKQFALGLVINLLLLANLSAAHAQDINEAANRLFVNSLTQIETAQKNADLTIRLQQMEQAKAQLRKIISDYPGSDLAVRIISENFSGNTGWFKRIDKIMTPVRTAVYLQKYAERCLPKPTGQCLSELVGARDLLPRQEDPLKQMDLQELSNALKALQTGDRKPFMRLVRNQGKNLNGLATPFFLAEKLEILADLLFKADRVVLHGRREFSSRNEAMIHLAQTNRRLTTPKIAKAEIKRTLCANEGRFAAIDNKELHSKGLFPSLLRLTTAMCKDQPLVEPARDYLREYRRRRLLRLKNYPSSKDIYEMLESFNKLEDLFALTIKEQIEQIATPKNNTLKQGHDVYRARQTELNLPRRLRTYAMALLIKRAPAP